MRYLGRFKHTNSDDSMGGSFILDRRPGPPKGTGVLSCRPYLSSTICCVLLHSSSGQFISKRISSFGGLVRQVSLLAAETRLAAALRAVLKAQTSSQSACHTHRVMISGGERHWSGIS